MIVEILYEELCCLYGDKGNTTLLKAALPEAEFVFTQLSESPAFLSRDVALVCMYSMSEQSQERILKRWLPHKDAIVEAVKNEKTQFLLTGNAMELFGKYIEREDGSKVEALGIFDTYAVRQTPNRFNTLVRGTFEGQPLIGYTSRFSHTYGVTEQQALFVADIGKGVNPDTALEGIRVGSVTATYLLGPVLVNNPPFAKWVLSRIGANDALPFEDTLTESYKQRCREYDRPDLEMN